MKFDVWFGPLKEFQETPQNIAPPPVELDDTTLDELISDLEGITRIPRPALSAEAVNEPWPYALENKEKFSWTVSGQSNAPYTGSLLANQTGFEVEFAVREWQTLEELVRQMERTISEKDVPKNCELFIVAGGPTEFGRIFPAGALLALQTLEAWHGPAVKPTNLRRVFLVVWGENKVYLLYEAE